MSDFSVLRGRLNRSLFLSSMMGTTDGAWSAAHCRGVRMAQLGAYLLDGPADRRGVFRPDSDEAALTAHLRKQFEDFRAGLKGVDCPVICANMFLCEERSLESSVRSFVLAGGDIYELNVHGGGGNDRERGTGHCMFFPQHAAKLHRWVRLLAASGVPVIVKARARVIADYVPHLEMFEEAGVFGFHINVRDEKRKAQDLASVEVIRGRTGLFLLASGYVKDSEGARRLFDAGADAVGIAEAARHDPDVFVKCAESG